MGRTTTGFARRARRLGGACALGALVAGVAAGSALPAEPPTPAAATRAPRAASPLRLFRPASAPPLVRPKPSPSQARALDPEARTRGARTTVWLNRAAPEAAPVRLTPARVRALQAAARGLGVDWALALGRTKTRDPERAQAYALYYRALGLDVLTVGVEASKRALVRRVLGDRRIRISPEGREDVATGRIDAQVLAVVLYLGKVHGTVTISSLHTGHELGTRPGVISAHAYGLAVDITAFAGKPLFRRPKTVEAAARAVLLLPPDARPQQVLSVASLPGSRFRPGERPDHLHLGF